jgi:hypothetical protein
MRCLFIIIAITLAAATSAFAQMKTEPAAQAAENTTVELVPGMKYKVLKNIYDYKDYEPSIYDSRSPGGMGVASFFIPGLGQMISGEIGRGLAWVGGHLGAYVVTGIGASMMNSADYYDAEDLEKTGTILFLAGFASMLTLDICSIVDAVRVAKVRNMYERDLYKKMYSLDLHPSVNHILTPTGSQPTAGFTLALNF